jgi:hypothetical protein
MKLIGENRSTRRETCPSATLSTINPTWTDPGSSPGIRGERPATNRLSHGTAKGHELHPPITHISTENVCRLIDQHSKNIIIA